jgi:hypothetical protein
MSHRLRSSALLCFGLAALLVAGPAAAQTNTTVAPPAAAAAPAAPADEWKLKPYGFVEVDAVHDSTQSFPEASLNLPIAARGTYLGDNAQTQFTAKNSRVGLDVGAPAFHRLKASGRINFDFFGIQPTEATDHDFYVLGTMRLRDAYLKLETPVVDVLVGQHPTLFGWGGAGFYPATVAFLGVVGQVYDREPQLRVSKRIGRERGLLLEPAAAALRPAQRQAEMPDLEGGLRLAHQGWLGRTMQGNDRPELVPLSLGVSGLYRRFAVAEHLEVPRRAITSSGWGLAVNALLPILPARDASDFRNCLTLTGEFSIGSGVADRYSGLTGGARFPAVPNPANRLIPPVYVPNIDSGMVTFDANDNLKTIDWQALVVGVQYYLPVPVVRVWVNGVYSRLKSKNLAELTPPPNLGDVYTKAEYFDASVFAGITPDVQAGFGAQLTKQTIGNGPKPRNIRLHLAMNFFF